MTTSTTVRSHNTSVRDNPAYQAYLILRTGFIVAPILFASGIAIGYGAKLAGGCTSGNGLTGASMEQLKRKLPADVPLPGKFRENGASAPAPEAAAAEETA